MPRSILADPKKDEGKKTVRRGSRVYLDYSTEIKQEMMRFKKHAKTLSLMGVTVTELMRVAREEGAAGRKELEKKRRMG